MNSTVIDDCGYNQVFNHIREENVNVFLDISDRPLSVCDGFKLFVDRDLELLTMIEQKSYFEWLRDLNKTLNILNSKVSVFRVQLDRNDVLNKFALTVSVAKRKRENNNSEYMIVKLLKPECIDFNYGVAQIRSKSLIEYCFYYDRKKQRIVAKSSSSKTHGNLVPVPVNDDTFFKLIKLLGLEKQFLFNSPILKDVLRLRNVGFHVPLSIEYVSQFHNLREMWQNKFHTKNLGKVVNHQFLIDTYVMYHLSKYLDLTYYRKLNNRLTVFTKSNHKPFFNAKYYDTFRTPFFNAEYYNVFRTGSKVWLQKVLSLNESLRFCDDPNNDTEHDEISQMIFDILKMRSELKLPWKISATCKKGLIREHDMLIDKLPNSYAKINLKLPRWSQKLSDFLNDNSVNLMILKTSSRIVREGRMMHNCVGSYVPYVNEGQCVILHYDDGEIKCTVEICNYGSLCKPCYVLSQIYQTCNVTAPKKVTANIKNILKMVNKL